MIITWPNMPDTDGDLKVPRPAVYLLGSYNLEPATYQWQHDAAKTIDDRVGAVFYGICPDKAFKEFTRWSLFWLSEADIVAMWMEPPQPPRPACLQWTEFEFGLALGLARSGKIRPPLIGSDPAMPAAVDAMGNALDALGFPTTIYNKLDELMHAVGEIGRGMR